MRKIFLLVLGVLISSALLSQVVINEGSYRNLSQMLDLNGKAHDWIELYNTSPEPVSLFRYCLSDDASNLRKWTFPNIQIPGHQWLIVYASGVPERLNPVHHWETAVKESDSWKWINPVTTTETLWMSAGYDDRAWHTGIGGFGYGDGDDRTMFPLNKVAVYTRISLFIRDTASIAETILHVDYDDGFVAYFNGVEIARSNIEGSPMWNTKATASHEAVMYQGQRPEKFSINMDFIRRIWQEGENVLAIEAHNNTTATSASDMSLRVFLSFGLKNEKVQFGPTPAWFFMDENPELHANFKISSKGETIYLTDNKDNLLDRLILSPGLPPDYSIGRALDGSSEQGVFVMGTPGKTNRTRVAYTHGFETMPTITPGGGFYADHQVVTITTGSATAQVRYTLTGQDPTTESALYTGPITIDSTHVLKACCMSTTGKLPSIAAIQTYFIGESPTPAGVLSLTMDNKHLYGDLGIYDNWWTDWKRPCYIEYFEPGTHVPVFKQNAAIKAEGGAGGSRDQPQHSFRIEPGNSAVGDGDVEYPLIPSRKDRTTYETFYLRNGSNQYLYYPCKDAIETRCMGEGTFNTYSGYTPVQVYLNGQYWGYYELREKLDTDYFKQHEQTDADSLDILSVSYFYGGTLREVEGNDPVTRFISDYSKFLSLNPQSENFWEEADQYFDLEYYTDYICAQSWMADVDWPYNNIRMHRSPETGHRWRFSLIDLELSLNPNGWQDNSFDHINYCLTYDSEVPYIHIWQKAMLNPRYHDYFINRFADLMNTAWSRDKLWGIANEIYNQTRPELPATFKRWADPLVPTAAYMQQFDQAHQIMLSELSLRTRNVRSHIRSNFKLPGTVATMLAVKPAGAGTIRISTVEPEVYPWTGTWFAGVRIKIEAIPGPGFCFEGWDSNPMITDAANPVFLDTLFQSSTFSARFKVGNFSKKVIVSEINYNSESSVNSDDWVEFWNTDTLLEASLTGWHFTDSDPSHVFTFPDNTRIIPGGRLVIARNALKFGALNAGIGFLPGLAFGFGADGDAVRLYDHTGTLVSGVTFDDQLPWPIGADGKGRTLELRNPSGAPDDPLNWFDGCIGGSPGRPYTPCAEAVIFSEIDYHNASSDNSGDWVELRNLSNTAVDLTGWKFSHDTDSTGHSYFLPPGRQLQPRSNLVLVQDVQRFITIHPEVTQYMGPFTFDLKDKGDWIRAYDFSGKLRLSVSYSNSGPWPAQADGLGFTLELIDPAGIMNDGINWMAGCYGGSPGKDYSLPCPSSGLSEDYQDPDVIVYPNPVSDRLFINSTSQVTFSGVLVDIAGNKVLELQKGTGDRNLNLEFLSPGVYFLHLEFPDRIRRSYKVVR